MRIRLLSFALSLLFSNNAHSWFCDEGASIRRDNFYEVCGIAAADNEQSAREEALRAAYQEFDGICDKSKDCNGFEKNIRPLRNECRKVGAKIECRRMIEVEVLASRAQTRIGSTLSEATAEVLIYKGQRKDELIQRIGFPNQILDATTDGSSSVRILYYRDNPICSERSCSIVIRNNKVERYANVRPNLSDELNTKSGENFWSRLADFLGLR